MIAHNQIVDYKERQQRLVSLMLEANLRGFALNAGPSLTYLTGLHFHLSERPVVALFTYDQQPLIILPELEAGKLDHLSYAVQAYPYGEDPETWGQVFHSALQSADLVSGRVGLEPNRMRVLEMSYLEMSDLEIDFVPGEACMTQLRIHKDQAEISAMQKAVQIAQAAMRSTIPEIKPGISELELAAELTIHLLQHGSDSQLPFTPIVASGPNSANPHAFPGDRKLVPGDVLIIDWGASFGGYYSDLTRTYAIGEPEEDIRQIAQIVQQANAAARETARPGTTCHAVDQAAREIIETSGYGEYFIHRTGHGLGLESHEAPYIREGNMMSLETGMTFTIEPGIYIRDLGGVRIEDDVVVTDEGLTSLSDLARDLQVLEF